MVDFDFIRVHLLSPPACVCTSACSRYDAKRITSRMPPAAWSGQWVSNAGGHQSRDPLLRAIALSSLDANVSLRRTCVPRTCLVDGARGHERLCAFCQCGV